MSDRIGRLYERQLCNTSDEALVRENDAIHGDVDFDYIVNRIEPMIRDELKGHEFIEKDKPYSSMDSRFIFAFKDKVFTIEYGAIIEHADYVAIGSGECEAIGICYHLMKTKALKIKLLKRLNPVLPMIFMSTIRLFYPIPNIQNLKS